MKDLVTLAVLVGAVCMSGFSCGGQELPHRSEQLVFGAELGMKKPVPLPASLLSQLSEDRVVRQILAAEVIKAEDLPETWFVASEVHLSKRSTPELIVMAMEPLAGANVTTFWIFRRSGRRFQPILIPPATAHSVEILATSSNGFRDIRMFSATAVDISSTRLSFDGKVYKQTATALYRIR